MRIVPLLAVAAVLLLAGCASNTQQSTTNPNASVNNTCMGSGSPVVTTPQIGNGAGDPTGNTGACPSATATAAPSPTLG